MASNSLPIYINKGVDYEQYFDYYDEGDGYLAMSLEEIQTKFNEKMVWEVLDKDLIETTIKQGQEFCSHAFSNYLNNPNLYLQNVINRVLLS
jgi:hypothetical protein